MQGLGDHGDDDVPPAAAYSYGVASENGRKADEEDVDDVQAVLAEEGEEKIKVSLSSSQSSMDDIRRPSGLGPTIEEHASIMRAYRVQVPPLPPYRPRRPIPEIPPLPVEVLATILSLLPRMSVPTLALLSRDFLSAAQAVLYGDLDMRDVRNPDMLWIFLVTRRDLTSLTHTLRVPAWPSPQTRAYLIPRVIARIDNLRSLTTPSFDIRIVRHHSAFRLRHIEFGNTRLSEQAETELLTWLDGQTNVVSIRFKFLLDDDNDASPPTPLPATPTHTHLLSAPTTPCQPFEARRTLSLANFHYSSMTITIRDFPPLRHAPDFSQHQACSRYFPRLRCRYSRQLQRRLRICC